MTNLNEEINAQITDTIQTELLKRGFLASITIEVKDSDVRLTSEEFQTVPVIFKTIKLSGLGGLFAINDDWTGFSMTVSVAYTHFDGGSNGCDLFTIQCKFLTNDCDANLCVIKIK